MYQRRGAKSVRVYRRPHPGHVVNRQAYVTASQVDRSVAFARRCMQGVTEVRGSACVQLPAVHLSGDGIPEWSAAALNFWVAGQGPQRPDFQAGPLGNGHVGNGKGRTPTPHLCEFAGGSGSCSVAPLWRTVGVLHEQTSPRAFLLHVVSASGEAFLCGSRAPRN